MQFDWATFEKCEVAAERGDPNIEFDYAHALIFIDEVYDPKEGIFWLKKAAYQRHLYAQVALAMYQSKESFPDIIRDLVDSYAWFATFNPNPGNSELAKLEKRMTNDQIQEAKELAKKYQQFYPGENSTIIQTDNDPLPKK